MPRGTQQFRVTVSTYRLHLNRDFGFAQARSIVPYLAKLGITDCYTSPILQARPGSPHGYDICNHNQLNPELGTEADYALFAEALTAHGMGQVVDFVPNHMGIDAATNPRWRNVLENGRCSPFADFFDIDWHPVKPELHDKILLPILGDQYGLVLERGELVLCFAHGSFTLRYFEHELPLDLRRSPILLEHELERLRLALGDDHPDFVEYLSIITALRNLPAHTETAPGRIAERHREKEVARERLMRLLAGAPRIQEHIEEAIRAFNGTPGTPTSYDRLHELLETQPYRIASWRTASHEVNYRHFFDINELAALHMEDSQVFAATHELILRLVREGRVTGLRIDHIDGLFDPGQYLERLQQAAQEQQPPHRAAGVGAEQFYVVVEKILSAGETLSDRWSAAGTSGYDYLNELNGVFVNRRNHRALQRVYRRFTGFRKAFSDTVYEDKKLIMDGPMASELNMLAHALSRLAERDRRRRDFTLTSLRDVLQEVVACLPIYRTYVNAAGATSTDRTAVETAIRRARHRNPTMESSIFEFLRNTLLPDPQSSGFALRVAFAMKFQQYTGPVQAKELEDTACYRYNLLASLNEVGGDAGHFGYSPADFHEANQRRRQRHPFSMLTSSTHDTKRGEDVRSRLNALSEFPEEWGRNLSAWAKLNAANRTVIEGDRAPDRNDEYLFYQTLLGLWPSGATSAALRGDQAFLARLQSYMLKALCEAKVHTSWITQNSVYEAAVSRFVERTLNGPTAERLLAAFHPFQSRIAQIGMVNSLSQLILKVASPGVPDFYQGSELWDLTLVDPDNRRPIDYALRQELLASIEPLLSEPTSAEPAAREAAVGEMLVHWHDGRIKLFVTASALRLRAQYPAVFLQGTYDPLEAEGEWGANVLTFIRRHHHTTVIIVLPRLVAVLTTAERPLPVGDDAWGDTRLVLPAELSTSVYRNILTAEVHNPQIDRDHGALLLTSIFKTCPVALLISTAGAAAALSADVRQHIDQENEHGNAVGPESQCTLRLPS